MDRLRTAACTENMSGPIETERFLSTLERSCFGSILLKIKERNQLLLFSFDMLVKLIRNSFFIFLFLLFFIKFYHSDSGYLSF